MITGPIFPQVIENKKKHVISENENTAKKEQLDACMCFYIKLTSSATKPDHLRSQCLVRVKPHTLLSD